MAELKLMIREMNDRIHSRNYDGKTGKHVRAQKVLFHWEKAK